MARRNFATYLATQTHRDDDIGALARRYACGPRRYSFRGLVGALFTAPGTDDRGFAAAHAAHSKYRERAS